MSRFFRLSGRFEECVADLKIYQSTTEHPTDMPLTDSDRADSPLSSDINPESTGRRLDQLLNMISISGLKMSQIIGRA